MDLADLKADYALHRSAAELFLAEFLHQFSALLKTADIKLGVPLEGRVKDWESIVEKLQRKGSTIKGCRDLPDLIGVRAITLFRRDVIKIRKLIESRFSVSNMEDKAAQLDESRFGYLSHHYHAKIPRSWISLPSFGSIDFSIEIQIRTLSQHLWAASSHLLQYKKEADVPTEVSRSIHRVAALLETVDLEFERVLEERETYSRSSRATHDDSILDTDNIALTLNKYLPAENLGPDENYSELITNFSAFGIRTVGALKDIINENLKAALKEDKERVRQYRNHPENDDIDEERIKKGVFYTHMGLARNILRNKFGDDEVSNHLQKKGKKK